MKIVVFGLGYVGLTSVACLIREGHQVIGIDVHEDKVRTVARGESPIFEPGVDELLAQGVAEGRLKAFHSVNGQLADADIAVVCVGTPSAADGSHNLTHIAEVSREIALALAGLEARAKPLTVIYRSTLRPGSIERVIAPIFRGLLRDRSSWAELVYNPEFLRESTAIEDYFNPPKIVVGTADGQASATVDELYAGIAAQRFYLRFREAEITKLVDNSFHALKVAFANEIGRICAAEGVSAAQVHEVFVADTKLNISPYYLRPGGAFGGSCLPKDVRALIQIAAQDGSDTHVLNALLPSNEVHKRFMFQRAVKGLEPGAAILLNGLAFKPDSDDLRESPFVDLARAIIDAGFALSIWDPQLNLSLMRGQNLGYSITYLPELPDLLVDHAAQLKGQPFARIVDARGNAATLGLGDVPVVEVNRIP